MFWVWFAAITLATIAGIVVCVTQVENVARCELPQS